MSMDERSDVADKIDEVMLPGFRFHPTDEELVGFYLKRKIQQRPLSIELIRQLDIYKYDPWDLPKLATTGDKEWYFFCPRDRKYRNSARPNRVTEAGFWKATGTDRPIYSLEGSKCIGLKKSLVFYKGRAAKGIKTDWMMHEFRLPSLVDSVPTKRCIEKNNIPANDLWAICRIFKKANSNAQRALSHSWVSPALPETSTTLDMLTPHFHSTSQFSSDTTRASLLIHYDSSSANNDLLHSSIITSTTPNFDLPPFKPYNQMTTPYAFLSPETTNDNSTSNLLFNMSSSIFGDFDGIQDQFVNNGFSSNLLQEVQENVGPGGEIVSLMKGHCPNVASLDDEYWGNLIRSTIGFPYSLPTSMPESNLVCDSSSPCPSDQISTGYSTSKSNT